MTSIASLLAWEPAALDDVADELIGQRRKFNDLQDELDDSVVPGSWTGDASAAAESSHDQLRFGLSDLLAGLSAVVTAVVEAAASVTSAQRSAEVAIEMARAHSFSVDTFSGVVSDTMCFDLDEHELADRERLLTEIVDRLEQAVRAGDEADLALAAVLDSSGRGIDGGEGSLLLADLLGVTAGDKDVLPPPRQGSATEMAGWWASLSEDERTEVINDHPEWVGNVDGIPAVARDAANRGLLQQNLAEDRASLADLRDELADGRADLMSITEQMAAIEGRIESMEAIEDILSRHGDRQLLLLDPDSGDNFRAAIANGDVDTADHVSVFTPGFTSTVAGMGGYDDDMDDLQNLAAAESDAYGDGGTVATVTWLGYDAPQWDGVPSVFGDSVISSARAEEGGERLASFLNGIDASRPDDPQLMAMGHSYGSTTTGYALQHETGVDRAVVFGSPGLGADRVEDFDVPADEFFRIEARRDVVADLGGFGQFGIDPTYIDGLTGLSARSAEIDGQALSESTGHSSYLTDRSTSQHNQAVLAAGADEDRLVRDDGRGFGDWLSWTPDFLK